MSHVFRYNFIELIGHFQLHVFTSEIELFSTYTLYIIERVFHVHSSGPPTL